MLSFTLVGRMLSLGFLFCGAAQAADTMHVRGTVAAVNGSKIMIRTNDGKDVSLVLGDGWKIAGVTKASMADIKQGTFIGTANMVGSDGAKALEVVVFPDSMRGTGEGDYGWDLKPHSQMTNATVSNQVQGVDGQTVTLTYKGGEKKVKVAPNTPIVRIGSGTAADVIPGATVFISAPSGASDTLDKGFIAVGQDGAVPPM
jgi:uncharacterized protein Veg